MKEIYVLERFLGPGIWELTDSVYYTDYEIAKEELCKFMSAMKQFKMDPTVRITKLKSLKKQK